MSSGSNLRQNFSKRYPAYSRTLKEAENRNKKNYFGLNYNNRKRITKHTRFYTIVPDWAVKYYLDKNSKPIKNMSVTVPSGIWGTVTKEFDEYMKSYLKKNPRMFNKMNNTSFPDAGLIFQKALGVAPYQIRNNPSSPKLCVITFKWKSLPVRENSKSYTKLTNSNKVKHPRPLSSFFIPEARYVTNSFLKEQRKAWHAWHMPWGGAGKTLSFLENNNGNGLTEYVIEANSKIDVMSVQSADNLMRKYIHEVYPPKSLPVITKPNESRSRRTIKPTNNRTKTNNNNTNNRTNNKNSVNVKRL